MASADPWSALEAQRKAAAPAAAAPAAAAAAPADAPADALAQRTIRFGDTATEPAAGGAVLGTTRPFSAPARARQPPSHIVENRQVRKVLDHPLRPSAPAWPFSTSLRPADRRSLFDRGHVDLAPWDGAKVASSSTRKGWSSFGVQTVSQRATAAAVVFPTQPRVPAWQQNAERRRSEPGPANNASGVLRFKAIGAPPARHGSAGTAAARRQPPLPAGHFRHVPDPANAEGAAYVPYPLLHVRPIAGGIHSAPGRGPRAQAAQAGGGARTFGTARRQCALAAPHGVGERRAGGGAQPRTLYYVPMTR